MGLSNPTGSANPTPSTSPLKRLLVTTDFSEASRQAFPWAVELGKQFGATITLAYVFPTALPVELSQIGIIFEQKRLAGEAKARLDRFREAELPASLPVETVVLEGRPAHEITRFAKESGTDLIVTSTHGHTGFKHLWSGSTAERIVREAPCPVLVVREQPVPVSFPGDVLCRFHQILLPTDFSEASRPALHYAAAFAQPCNSEVTLIHVIEPPPYPEFGYAHVPLKEARLKQAVTSKLNVSCRELSQGGIRASQVIRTGSAFREISEQAREQSADLIVIGTHGRGAIAHALLGSTAERVVRHAPCPVLVVRQRERDFVAPPV
jgi:nucleotide-binding universal stress UspA family protein